MKFYRKISTLLPITLFLTFSNLQGANKPFPEEMQKIMDQPKYKHSFWGIYVKDLVSGEVLYDLNSDKLFSPASTTKLFSVEALLNAYGDDYRFKTPIYAVGKIDNGKLDGNIVLVAQGDLTMGGRQSSPDTISFTKLDHINANEVPGVILTKENPLTGFISLAKQVYQKGVREINGDILIDDSLFESTQKRGFTISPIMVNENFIDITLNPGTPGQKAELVWRPQVPGYEVVNQVKSVKEGEAFDLSISSDNTGHKIVVSGTLPANQHDVVRTFSIKDPANFARAALIQSLEAQGIKISLPKDPNKSQIPSSEMYQNLEPVALWTSPPLTEYAKLILKVSHNLGADLVPLLLAAQQGKRTFDEGMLLLGHFVLQNVMVAPDAFVFGDAAGGNENRLTPKAEVQLLEYIHKQPETKFKGYFDALPILGVDGSLEDFAKKSPGAGKVRAKPGTGVGMNLATGKFFLITQALAGYIEGKNGHLYAYMLGVNNGTMPAIDDIFPIFEDVSQLSSMIYGNTVSEKQPKSP